MDQTPPELAAALMQWINTFPHSKVQAWDDAADGQVLWSILVDIDPEHFQRALPESERKTGENWIPRWQNWRYIEKEVLQYIREECGRLPSLGRSMNADLKAIATTGSSQDILKMVKCVLLAAMYSDRSNERMVDVMSSLGPKVAQPIATFIGEMEELDQTMTDYDDEESSSHVDDALEEDSRKAADLARDPELERESKLIQALQDKRRIEVQLADALAELEESRNRLTTIEDELEESKYALDRRRGTSIDNKNVAQLNQRADQDREYIEKLESELNTATTTIDQQARQLERLKADADSKQNLRDDLQLVTSERDELRQKAKANENLRKKIQILQEQEKTTQILRHDLQMAQEQLQDFDSLRDRCTALEKANEENAQTIANGEQEIFDQKTAKRMLEHEMKTISHKWEQSRELLNNAQDAIRDMEERLRDTPESPRDESGVDLDAELNADDAQQSKSRATESSRRKSREPAITSDTIVLQQKLHIAATSVDRLEKRCLDLLQENLGFKSIIDDEQSQDMKSFQHQAQRIEDLSKSLDEAKSKYLRATSGDSIALEINEERQRYITDLEQTLRDQRNLLRHALLGTDALQTQDASIRASNEWQLMKHQLELVHSTSATEAQPVIKSTATSITDRIEGVRGALAAREKILAERDTDFEKLQKDFEALKMQPPPVPPKDPLTDKELNKQLLQLQRENKLIASAWYDLTCRLQSNTVHLARRAEGGRSWLNKMRASVNGGAQSTKT